MMTPKYTMFRLVNHAEWGGGGLNEASHLQKNTIWGHIKLVADQAPISFQVNDAPFIDWYNERL